MVSESTFTASEAEKTDDTASEERKKISITCWIFEKSNLHIIN